MYALAVPHLRIRALACPAVVIMFVAVGAFRGFKDTKYDALVTLTRKGFIACFKIMQCVQLNLLGVHMRQGLVSHPMP